MGIDRRALSKGVTYWKKYVAAGDKRSKVGMGVAGDPAYGNDSQHNARNGLRPQIREEVRPNAKEKALNRQA